MAPVAQAQQPADVLVVFGITGDLARVMTFRSLYRLELRGLLDCPIVGVAVDDWSDEHLRDHAREVIAATGEELDDDVFARFAARLSYVAGDFADAATYGRVADAVEGGGQPGLLPRDPAVPVRQGRRGAGGGGLTSSGRVVVEKPFGHDLGVRAGARRGAAPVHRRVAAVPDRPLPREDGPRGDPLPALRQHDARAGVEPEPRRVRRDHDGGGLRRRGPRALLRPGRRAAGRRGQPPHAGGGRGGDGAAVARRRRRR